MRLRVRYTKLGKLRFIAHRDVARLLERVVRRVELPVAWTKGFNPRPRLAFGLALPLFAESTAEYLDATLDEPVEPARAAAAMNAALPEGMEVVAAGVVPPQEQSLQEAVTSCTWELEVARWDHEGLAGLAARAGTGGQLPWRSAADTSGAGEALPEGVLDCRLAYRPGTGEPVVIAELATRPRGVRPFELADALGLEVRRAVRTAQWIGGEFAREPLGFGEGLAWPPLRRATSPSTEEGNDVGVDGDAGRAGDRRAGAAGGACPRERVVGAAG
jgi:radical SAM-linked protein